MALKHVDRLNDPLRPIRADLLRGYYEENRAAIEAVIDEHLQQGHRLALRCPGHTQPDNPGLIFTSVFDPDATKFTCISESTITPLIEPQTIYPFRSFARTVLENDAVFSFSRRYSSSQTIGPLKKIMPDFVVVEDLIWESVARKNAARFAATHPVPAAPEPARICSLTILYNPDQDVVESVASYSDQVGKAYLYDNSTQPDQAIIDQLKALPNVEYISGGGKNVGICPPINKVKPLAKEEGFNWFITFDQDSHATPEMIRIMREFVESPECTPNIAFVGPKIDTKVTKAYPFTIEPRVTYTNRIIQSGMLHRMSAMDEIGPYDERLFIDEVEDDYCAKARALGYDILRLNDAVLLHQIHDDTSTGDRDKYSPLRFYFRTRNMWAMVDRYSESNPRFVYDTLGGLMGLHHLIEADTHSSQEAVAVMLGYKHYAQGKWPTFDEALKELEET